MVNQKVCSRACSRLLWRVGTIMPTDDIKQDDNRTVLEVMSANIVEPLFAAPKQTIQATTRTFEYVGSRSKSHLNAVKQMSLSLLDVKERDKTCGQ
jgi:hypothetical protein